MQRYEPTYHYMVETSNGRYVKYEDVEELLDKIKIDLFDLRQKLMQLDTTQDKIRMTLADREVIDNE